MVFPKPAGVFTGFSLTRFIAPFFLPFVGAILYPIVCFALVAEKMAKLREIMQMSGLQRFTYLYINYVNYFGMYLFPDANRLPHSCTSSRGSAPLREPARG